MSNPWDNWSIDELTEAIEKGRRTLSDEDQSLPEVTRDGLTDDIRAWDQMLQEKLKAKATA